MKDIRSRWNEFRNSPRGKAVVSVIAVIAVLATYFSSRMVKQQVPIQTQGAARPTLSVPTETPKPGRITPTLASTSSTSPTATPSPSAPPTETPTETATPAGTETPMPSAVTCVNPMAGHDVQFWHPPIDEPGFAHHHGVNPCEYIEIFGEPLEYHLATYGAISYPWATQDENLYYGFGHHNAYVWLYDHAQEGCEFYNQNGALPTDTANCITDVLQILHTDGTQAHLRKRFHSHYAFMRVCAQEDGQPVEPCGTAATGGWVDYGILETPYKGAHCPLPGIDPPEPEGGFDVNQPPYRTSHIEYRPANKINLLFLEENRFWNLLDYPNTGFPDVVQFWSGLRPNPVVGDMYAIPYDPPLPYPQNQPNYTLGVAWKSLDAWGIVDPVSCANPELDVFLAADGSSALNNTAFQLFAFLLYQLPAFEPVETGFVHLWTNRWGLPVSNCVNAAVDCVPLLIGAGVPGSGLAIWNRDVNQFDTNAPVLEFDPGGGVILPPPLSP